MELSDIQASNGLNRRFFKGVGNSVGRDVGRGSAAESQWVSSQVNVAQRAYLVVNRCRYRAGGCQSLR